METIKWLIENVSYGNIFFVLFISGLGFPLPEEVTLMAAGAAAAMGHVDPVVMTLVCYAGIIGGDLLAFGLGRYFGKHVYDSAVARYLLSPTRMRQARYLFYKRGAQAVVIGRFLPGLRVSVFFVAGSMRVSLMAFLVADSLALIASAPLGLGLGWFLGSSLLTAEGMVAARRVLNRYHAVVIVGLAGVVLLMVGAWWTRRRKQQARRDLRASPQKPPSD